MGKREEWHADQLEARLENTEDCCKMLEALLQGISQRQGIIDNAPADAAVNAESAAEARDAADRAHSAADQAARAAAKSDALSAEMDELRALVDKKNRAGDASATSHLPKRVQLLEEEDLRISRRGQAGRGAAMWRCNTTSSPASHKCLVQTLPKPTLTQSLVVQHGTSAQNRRMAQTLGPHTDLWLNLCTRKSRRHGTANSSGHSEDPDDAEADNRRIEL